MLSVLLAAALSFTPSDAKLAYRTAREFTDVCTPRDAGTIRGQFAANFILDAASSTGADVRQDRFQAETPKGKKTFTNLLMRFYDVKDGSIAVDGSDIRTVTRQSLRHQYGMVLQDTWLKSGTVRENIRLAKPDAADEEVEAAAKKAHADSFIRRLPNGYDTMLSDTGGALSAGQRQLLCIARVMLCLPPMLILDEATSSIDTRTEVKIQQAFDEMMQLGDDAGDLIEGLGVLVGIAEEARQPA